GEGATVVDYVSAFVADGGRMAELADLVAIDVGHPVSRSFLTWTVNNIEPNAKERLQAARQEARLRERDRRPAAKGTKALPERPWVVHLKDHIFDHFEDSVVDLQRDWSRTCLHIGEVFCREVNSRGECRQAQAGHPAQSTQLLGVCIAVSH